MLQLLRSWLTPAPDSRVASIQRQGKSVWAEGVHLLWSVWVFITPAMGSHYDLQWVLLTVLSYPLFLLMFAKSMLASRRVAPRYALGLVAMSIALAPWYPSGMAYFIYGCVSYSMASAKRVGPLLLRLMLVNVVYVAVAGKVGYPWQALVSVPCMTIIIAVITHVERIAHEKDAALKLSQEEVRRLAATAERERIGRDLHDLLGHTLSLITLKLELSRKLFDRDAEAAKREVAEAERVARHALAEVRSAVTGIRATDLAAELASARLLLESSRVHLDYVAPPADLPTEIERGLSLILREAATNIARHAHASKARIEFERDAYTLRLRVSDDGRGGVGEDGNGLCGMRERVRALAGHLTIESPRGRGTVLLVTVPLPQPKLLPTAAPESAPRQPTRV
ncbi:sensor histidine kinase [Dyella sp. LX-66]|uniref:sensor histidine kinase n=1 Tax=unclassified Dyella TaxID=2634549 RepID=UPI001BE0108A|nr:MULTISPECIES: sensor histidine kinase [unclassified Dyella]MBT2118749.1 sensor histidine kinase [Dyella sp. LX-1]MBT2141098.1 sensor histidine kinase [Dyella sp. LX-66]